MKWYHKLIFPFLKTHASIDVNPGGSDMTIILYYKIFKGTIYVIAEDSL